MDDASDHDRAALTAAEPAAPLRPAGAPGLGLAPGDLPGAEAPPLTLPEQIAVSLARDIVNGRFAGGEKLSEAKLAERFHVSRGPIRDAIELLERNMFVYSRPRRSARVASMTRYAIRQVFDMRALLSG
ncbi:MAG: GntR family transcriptional regulator, partial [Pseudomonadota bacterium]|nr:GntR family transcriptional regulator [Pseudomonadota bacterium]